MEDGRSEAVENATIVCQVHRSADLSPGAFTASYAIKLDEQQKRQHEIQSTRQFKRRRLESKGKRNSKMASQEVREGETYKSSVDLAVREEQDTLEIPPPITTPTLESVPVENIEHVVLFDVETSGLGDDAEILQLSANTLNNSKHFDCYVLPENTYVSRQASQITGLSIVDKNGECILLYNGKQVDTLSQRDAMCNFLSFLCELNGPCLLVGHNAKAFDVKYLLKLITKLGLEAKFSGVIAGFGDTLPLFRSKYPNLQSHSQPNLYKHFVNSEYAAHNALEDVIALQTLLDAAGVSVSDILNHSVSLKSMMNYQHFLQRKKIRLNSLKIALCKSRDKVISLVWLTK
ncbi:DNA polymerase III PolC-type-like [Ptychodera flava]|uniref:DNA polymerase III PolC-type-like n=1 Tax=Ptychodera flava TaxID=63121 RepID=UPI00396A0C2E